MTAPWLHVIGIGEDGVDGLAPAARMLLESAEVILGGDRHQNLAANVTAERLSWPSPFDAMIDTIKGLKGRRAVVLVTGDPLWYSVGARIARAMPPDEILFHPQLSAFQWAAARMGWSMADLETLTVHGRPPEQMIPFIEPDQRLIILTTGAQTPAQIAAYLTARGFGPSRLTVMGALGGTNETRFDGTAEGWSATVPAFNTMAVEVVAGPEAQILSRVPGLPDSAFVTDGNMTKQELRAVTLAKLMPMRGALLWDIGCGSGSVAIEWMRAARDARAIGIEPREDRRALAAQNALSLGAPALRLIAAEATAGMVGLPAPDAVFIGGGLSRETFATAWAALKPFGRLVANGVTLETEALMLALHAEQGGDLVRIGVERAVSVGSRHGWKPQMTVTQWSLIKR